MAVNKVLTTPIKTNQSYGAYWINSPISGDVAQKIAELQAEISERFPDAIWSMPRNALHISFKAASPFYEFDKLAAKPDEPSHKIIEALEKVLIDVKPIKIHFEIIEAFPDAIILKAKDDGTYQRLRDQFSKNVEFPAGTRAAPNIIHTSICRYYKAIDLEEVKDFISNKKIDINMTVAEFRLVLEKLFLMIDFDTLQRFELNDN